MNFCAKCGNEISSNTKFCSNCGQENNSKFDDKNSKELYTLTIDRKWQFYLINPAIKIIIDNIHEYKVENGKCVKIPISKGKHNIAFYCSIRNKILDINIQNDITLNVKFNRITGSIQVK